MNWYRSSSIQLVISDLNDIAADLYRHRIRPAARKGGNGVYDSSQGGSDYVIPNRLATNIRATFAITELSPDDVQLVAVSSENPACCVTATVDRRGRLKDIVVPGQKKVTNATEERDRHETRPISSPARGAHSPLFFDDVS